MILKAPLGRDGMEREETFDDLLHGELKIYQYKKGYRYSVDALLLADFALEKIRGKSVLDMGCGVGVIALILAARGNPSRVVGVEIQPGLAELARRNAELNATSPKVEIIRGDATGGLPELGGYRFDAIATNPPFRARESGRHSPNPEKAIARHEIEMTIGSWTRSASSFLAADGLVFFVYPADEEKRLLDAAESSGLYLRRKRYALDGPGGRRKLVQIELGLKSRDLIVEDDVAIQTEAGKFSLDGYR